tara:strand:+ start:718 stop:1053 length:336 start_codon:yes stop_codon:yes gene_type:complete
MKELTDLIQTFIMGGLLVSGIKYVSYHMGPEYAAIFAAFPIGLISSYLMKNEKQVERYLKSYMKTISSLLIVCMVYFRLLKKKFSVDMSLGISMVLWLLLNLLIIFFNKQK